MKEKMFYLMKNESGISLIDILIAMAITAIVALGVASTTFYAGRLSRDATMRATMITVRENIFNVLNNYESWTNSVNNDANFSCAIASTGCVGSPYAQFNLYDASGAIYYNKATTNGFDENGTTCSSATNTPTRTCPIRVNLTWTSICTTCNPALVRVDVTFQLYRNGSQQTMGKYAFSMLKNVY